MKIIVTGSTGFVGQNLLPHLVHDGNLVTELSMRNGWETRLPMEYDSIIHLAGKAHDTKNSSKPNEYFEVNTELTKKLFEIFLKSTATDFIYFSSVKAVADTVEYHLTEKVLPKPSTSYGQSKHSAEEFLSSKVLPDGKRLFIMRPCMIHGPGNKGNLNLLYKLVKKGIPYPLAAFKNERSFLSVDNLIYIIKRIVSDRTIAGGIYNLADDVPLSTNDVVEIIARASMRPPRLWHVNPTFIKAVARIGDVLKLPLNSERLKKLTESYIVDNTKIKRALGLEKLPFESNDGLLKTIRSFNNIST